MYDARKKPMKKSAHLGVLLAAVLCLTVFTWAGASINPADYNVNVHVSSDHILERGLPRLNVVIDGQKYELDAMGSDVAGAVLLPGDYKARVVPTKAKAAAYELYRTYEFLFPDGKTRKYIVVGIGE